MEFKVNALDVLEDYLVKGDRVDGVLHYVITERMKVLEAALQKACNSLGAEISDYLDEG